MQTEQIHELNHNERKGEDCARKEFLSPPVIYYLPFKIGALLWFFTVTSLSRWCYYFIFLLHTCQICYLVSYASEAPLVWERAADSVCRVSFGCGSFFAVRLSLVILWAGFGI